MKTSILALTLSLLSATTAAPSTAPAQNNYPYSIGTLSLKRLTDNTFNIIFYVTRHTDTGSPISSTTCQTAWNPSPPAGAENPVSCADPTFAFFFPTGIKNLEEYELTVSGPDGTVSGSIAHGPKYACGPYEGVIEGVVYECKTTNGGEFYFPLV
ncbi:hypothetical protein BJY04DRAFT_192800 [Aspergillus karnatakaensis]|uniref:uncharacterized protein n=1 Tax=Aspergillus karnatakaensis TaxID=1810916 RepID=UPI003CCD9862